MEADIDRILLHRDRIRARVHELAEEIARVYANDLAGLTFVPILSGSIIFLADLIRELPMRMKIALVHLSTYRGATPGEPKLVMEALGDLVGRNVVIIDDILDTGRTLGRVQQMVRERGAATVRTAVLLRKPGKAAPEIAADFVGFDIEDLFVVGYGLDFDDHYRNYPHIGVLRPELMPCTP